MSGHHIQVAFLSTPATEGFYGRVMMGSLESSHSLTARGMTQVFCFLDVNGAHLWPLFVALSDLAVLKTSYAE